MTDERLKRRVKQLKFLASMFKMAMEEFDKVMGPETIQTIFRLIGENQGVYFQKMIKEKYHIDKWDLQKIAELLNKEVLIPALGENQATVIVSGNTLKVIINSCPFKRAGIPISNKYYCTYTQGLVETIAKEALGKIKFNTNTLRAIDKCDCEFKIEIE